jgi:Ca2+-binding EF-hand superfamily protein
LKQIENREMPTVIHSLKLVPTQGEMQDMLAEMEDSENPDMIRYEKYISVMTDILMNRKFVFIFVL